jgi:hypothetical protein
MHKRQQKMTKKVLYLAALRVVKRIEPLILCHHYKKVPPEGIGGHL